MIQDTINSKLKAAMKARDSVTVSTLRLLNSEIKNAVIDKGEPLNDAEVQKVVSKEAKKRKDAIEALKQVQSKLTKEQSLTHKEKIQTEEKELEILKEYLPDQLSDTEVAKLVDEAVKETGAKTMADMKSVMGTVMSKASGQVDGSMVARLVQEKLQ
ncbi:GatB/YqeY domain-containing protein [Patescibacteria group bacterium]